MFNLPEREEGQGLVEYALILVLVAIAAIIILAVLGSTVALVYVRVVGGLNGQSLTSSGVEYMVLSADIAVSGSSACSVTVSNATVAVVSDGKMLKNSSSVSIPITSTTGSSSMSGTTDNLGLASGLGGSVGAPCGGKVTIGNTGYSIAANP